MPPKSKAMSTKPKPKPKAWFFYPRLHNSVATLLQEHNLHFDFDPVEADTNGNSPIHERDTSIMGRFICYNRSCPSHGWPSKTIAITIRQYRNQRYDAKVYMQRCRQCNRLGKALVDEQSYAERVAYWLKQWNGVRVESLEFKQKEFKKPHESHLCEGCKAGHCLKARTHSTLLH